MTEENQEPMTEKMREDEHFFGKVENVMNDVAQFMNEMTSHARTLQDAKAVTEARLAVFLKIVDSTDGEATEANLNDIAETAKRVVVKLFSEVSPSPETD